MLSIRRIGVIGRTYRHINRYRQILRALFKYGFDDLLDTLRLEEYLELGLQMISRKKVEHIEKLTRAERFRTALEELGPTFVKIGQILSTRPDLIPLQFVKELAKLQDTVAPFPVTEAREIFKSQLGRYPEEVFDSFEEKPLAAASIGQVHRARLKGSGDEVVVKIQRPNIREIIEVDLEIMLHLAALAENHLEELEIHRPTRLIKVFADNLEKEINYVIEAANIEQFARNFIDDETVYVPRVYRELSTRLILTMEHVHGIKASEVERLAPPDYDRVEIARRGADLIMKQVFVTGFFHGDPHPGNIFILPGNIFCFVDFGMMGRINRQEREDFSDLITHLVRRDDRRTTETVLKLTTSDKEPDRAQLERDITEFIDQFFYLPLKDIDAGTVIHQMLEILSRHGLRIRPNLFLMLKALGTADGLGRLLDPEFELARHVEPFVRKIQANRLHLARLATDMFESTSEFLFLLKEVPRELRAILKQARQGRMTIEFQHRGLEQLLYTQDRTSNRIAFAIVLAALIIGSSLIVLSGIPPKWHEIPVIGLLGFVVAGIMGFWLLLSILRRGRM